MKKIFYFILILIILYILSIFIFPLFTSSIAGKIGLTSFNEKIIELKTNLDNFITNFDIKGKYDDTTKEALEIKQKVETTVKETQDKVETTIKETQDKVDNIRNNVDKTTKAIDDTTKSVNNTINTLNDLQKSVKEVVPKTNMGN